MARWEVEYTDEFADRLCDEHLAALRKEKDDG
jgi:hypothetical protein